MFFRRFLSIFPFFYPPSPSTPAPAFRLRREKCHCKCHFGSGSALLRRVILLFSPPRIFLPSETERKKSILVPHTPPSRGRAEEKNFLMDLRRRNEATHSAPSCSPPFRAAKDRNLALAIFSHFMSAHTESSGLARLASARD